MKNTMMVTAAPRKYKRVFFLFGAGLSQEGQRGASIPPGHLPARPDFLDEIII